MKFLILFFITFLYGDNVIIQLKWKYQFQFAGFIIAKEKGFYKDLGLNVELRELNSSVNVEKFVLTTPNSYGVGDSGLIKDILNKTPIELLMPIYETSPFVLTAINLRLNSIKDIKSHQIVLDQFAVKNPEILAMLKSQNLNLKDLNIQKKNFYNDFNQQGVFAFYKSNELFYLKKHNIPYQTFQPKKYGFDFYGDILFTSKKEFLTHPQRVKKVIEATKKGFRYAFNHIDETIDIIYNKYNTQHFSKEKLRYEANVLKDYLSNDFSFNLNKLNEIKRIYLLLSKGQNVDLKDYVYFPFWISLTKKEKQFIKTHIIKAISTDSWEPFNLEYNGKLEGIAIDYWKYIQNKVFLKSDCFVADSWREVLDSIKNKQKDITCSTTITPDRKKYAIFSKPYVSFPIVIATRNDVGFIENIGLLKDKIIVVGKDYTADVLLKKHYPDLKILEVKNTTEALRLVSEGKAFGAVDILPVIAYKINKYNFANLKISGKTPFIFDVRFMVRKDYPELVSIINKVIDTIPESEKVKIYTKWIAVNYQNGIMPKELNKIYFVIGIIFLIIIAWIITLLKEIEKRKKLEAELEILATIDKLTSIFNRYKIDLSLQTQIEIAKRYNRPLSVIFFDIDHFKRINDTYGHKVGDLVLMELAKLVSQHIRSSDIFGRWGGEEFLIILPETTLHNAKKLAEKLRSLIENHDFEVVDKVTCSFGVTMFHKDDTPETIIKRVDDLLYQAKTNGRNQVVMG